MVRVWAPASQHWTLSVDRPTVRLSSKLEAGSDLPRWQNLGSVESMGKETLAIVVDDARPTPETPAVSKKESEKSARPIPVPALLEISTDPEIGPSPALDLVRGRLDTIEPPVDARRTTVRTNQQGAEFQPPEKADAWRDRARAVREQLLVTLGLWPMFPKTPLHPRIVGKLERDGYTIEKVVLETLPGFTLSGNLYRPTGKTGKLPLMLCPHGHWAEGRVRDDVQHRCVRWAKLGCVVFLYDMVGYADGKAFGHAFLNDRLRRWGLSLVTLQTWNSIRALDWLTTLLDVDPARIGCTGESGAVRRRSCSRRSTTGSRWPRRS